MRLNAEMEAQMEAVKRRVDQAVEAARSGRDVIIVVNGQPVGMLQAFRVGGEPQAPDGPIEIHDDTGALMHAILHHLETRFGPGMEMDSCDGG